MSTMDDVRRNALALPGVAENGTRFDVAGRGFASPARRLELGNAGT